MKTSNAYKRGLKLQRIDWIKMRKEIIALYKHGASTREIGKIFCVSHTTVCKHLDEWHIPRRTGDKRRGILLKDLVGQRRGRLTIIGREGKGYPPRWITRCDCGNVQTHLLSELTTTKSCGCGPRGRKKK